MNDSKDSFKTQTSLLSRVRRGDEEGWTRFYALYEEFFYLAATGAGLAHEDARDVVQESMLKVRDYIENFTPDPARARFRTWLRSIVQSRIADHYRRKKRNPLERAVDGGRAGTSETGTAFIDQIPNWSEVELDRLIDGQFDEAILAEARRITKAQVRAEDYQAYDMFDLRGLPAKDVAIALGIGGVTARVRAFRVRRVVERAIRRIVRSLDAPPNRRCSG